MTTTAPSRKIFSRATLALGATALALMIVPQRAHAAAAAAEPTIEELLRASDDLTRGKSSKGKISMNVKTARWDRSMTMEVWSEGTEKSLIKILSPAKEKGTATLKVDDNIWNYLPKVDRTIKVPASMMSGSWMGSHFSNDDLVKESRYTDDFKCKFTGKPADNPDKLYSVECIPNADAAVVWGKVVLKARPDLIPTAALYYDEKGELVRTMTFSDVVEMGGRKLPRKMTLTVTDKPEEFTEVIYESIEFDLKVPARTFTLQALKR
jgi:outer membrane lipoprotein-sorting protein